MDVESKLEEFSKKKFTPTLLQENLIKENCVDEILQIYNYLCSHQVFLNCTTIKIEYLISAFFYNGNIKLTYIQEIHLLLIEFLEKELFSKNKKKKYNKLIKNDEICLLGLLFNSTFRKIYRDFLQFIIWPKILLELIHIFKDVDKKESSFLLKNLKDVNINTYNSYSPRIKLKACHYLIKIIISIRTFSFGKMKLDKIIRKKKQKIQEIKKSIKTYYEKQNENIDKNIISKEIKNLKNKKEYIERKVYFSPNLIKIIGIDFNRNTYLVFYSDPYTIFKYSKNNKWSYIRKFNYIINYLQDEKCEKDLKENIINILDQEIIKKADKKIINNNKDIYKKKLLNLLENKFEIDDSNSDFKDKTIYDHLLNDYYKFLKRKKEIYNLDPEILKEYILQIERTYSQFLKILDGYWITKKEKKKFIIRVKNLKTVIDFNEILGYMETNFKKVKIPDENTQSEYSDSEEEIILNKRKKTNAIGIENNTENIYTKNIKMKEVKMKIWHFYILGTKYRLNLLIKENTSFEGVLSGLMIFQTIICQFISTKIKKDGLKKFFKRKSFVSKDIDISSQTKIGDIYFEEKKNKPKLSSKFFDKKKEIGCKSCYEPCNSCFELANDLKLCTFCDKYYHKECVKNTIKPRKAQFICDKCNKKMLN